MNLGPRSRHGSTLNGSLSAAVSRRCTRPTQKPLPSTIFTRNNPLRRSLLCGLVLAKRRLQNVSFASRTHAGLLSGKLDSTREIAMPKVFISYSHDSAAHKDRILALSNQLRAKGIDCYIDQYEQSPSIGWPQWCENQVAESAFVLVACTPTYIRRFKKEEQPGQGQGAVWEGHVISQELYNSQGRNTKFIPVIFSSNDRQHIPLVLQSATCYDVVTAHDALYRRLTNQHDTPAPPLGNTEVLPAREPLPTLERKPDFQASEQLTGNRILCEACRKYPPSRATHRCRICGKKACSGCIANHTTFYTASRESGDRSRGLLQRILSSLKYAGGVCPFCDRTELIELPGQ